MELNTGKFEAMRDYAQRQVSTKQFAGIAWQVEQDGIAAEQGCAGYADAEQTTALQLDAIYRIYSMTKPIVSVRCLQLVEAGLLQLSDPISRWLPAMADLKVLNTDGSFSDLERPITIEDLLTHRAGFTYDFLANCPVAELYREAELVENGSRSLNEMIDVLATLPLANQPGARWHYSYATDVLGAIVQTVGDQSLGEQLKQSLFDPLGMQDTGYSLATEKQGRLMTMFGQVSIGGVADASLTSNTLNSVNPSRSHPLQNPQFERGGHGLYSTLGDYSAFTAVLMHGRAPSGENLLSAPMLDFLWNNRLPGRQVPIAINEKPYPGYGWSLIGRVMVDPGQAMKLTVKGEGGWSGAAATWFWVDRLNGFSGVVMTQYLGSAVPVGSDMQALAYGALQAANT